MNRKLGNLPGRSRSAVKAKHQLSILDEQGKEIGPQLVLHEQEKPVVMGCLELHVKSCLVFHLDRWMNRFNHTDRHQRYRIK